MIAVLVNPEAICQRPTCGHPSGNHELIDGSCVPCELADKECQSFHPKHDAAVSARSLNGKILYRRCVGCGHTTAGPCEPPAPPPARRAVEEVATL